MLTINGEDANVIQHSLFHIYYESKELLECVKQFKYILSEEGWKEIDESDIYLKNPKLLSSTIFSLKYAIIIGTSKLFDNDKKCITISKLLNQCEQMKIKEYNKYLNKIKTEFNTYDELKDYIGLCRDKMYAHTDKVFNQKNDKYEYTLNEKIISNLLSFLNWTLDVCVEISVLYDQDKMHLKMDRNFQLSKEQKETI